MAVATGNRRAIPGHAWGRQGAGGQGLLRVDQGIGSRRVPKGAGFGNDGLPSMQAWHKRGIRGNPAGAMGGGLR